MQRIEPVVKDYAWGSRVSLAALSGRPFPTPTPEAELWVGAHEHGPALVVTDDGVRGLDAHVESDHAFHLGARCVEEFGRRLPFLLKILAADKALSIQAHPDAARACGAPAGTYGDRWPKPEAWIPLTECEAFAGSVPFAELDELFARLAVPALLRLADDARGCARPEHEVLTRLLHLDAAEQPQLVAEIVAAVLRESQWERDAARRRSFAAIIEVHEQFPGDIGVAVLLTMRHHVLEPGQSYFIAAGVLHSFVKGTTIEVLANSDNVVRAGLTPKEVDVDELLAIVDTAAEVVAEQPRREGDALRYPSGVPQFTLWEIDLGDSAHALPCTGAPAVLLCLGGEAQIESGDDVVRLARLEAAWRSAGDGDAQVTGTPGCRLFIATLNDALVE